MNPGRLDWGRVPAGSGGPWGSPGTHAILVTPLPGAWGADLEP